jgi:hypothetical protein
MPRPSRSKKRPYDRRFTPTVYSSRYLLDKIPEPLWSKARIKAKREGLSMRGLLLQLLTEWLEKGPR